MTTQVPDQTEHVWLSIVVLTFGVRVVAAVVVAGFAHPQTYEDDDIACLSWRVAASPIRTWELSTILMCCLYMDKLPPEHVC